MPQEPKVRRALLSVYDKTGIVEFARALHDEFGVELISTGGTARALRDAGLPVTRVEEVTGFPELLDGRVKTLHPKIHAAILADRDNPEHMRQLAEQGIEPIDLVVVNLYPFEKTVADPSCTFAQAIEMIDIGGPCLLRAAAKNHEHVIVLHDPADWGRVLAWAREDALTEDGWRRVRSDFAASAFRLVCAYNAQIVRYLRSRREPQPGEFVTLFLEGWETPRYGENPHQTAEVFALDRDEASTRDPHLLHLECPRHPSDVPLSFNNYADASAALELCADLTRASARHAVSTAEPDPPGQAGGARQGVWHRPMAGGFPAESGTSRQSEHPPRPKANPSSSRRPIDDETASRRNLPHIQRPGATYFLTFRIRTGTFAPEERDLVMECCLFGDRRQHCLHAAVCMPNHVHLLLTPLPTGPRQWHALTEILHDLKGNIGRRVADARGHTGPVLQEESFDHIIRNRDDFFETLEYIRTNPERAKLTSGRPYPWLVVEEQPDWDVGERAGMADVQHRLSAARAGERSWYARLQPGSREIRGSEAGLSSEATPGSGSGRERPAQRPLAGATQAGKAQPTSAAPKQAENPPTRDHAERCPPAVCFIKHTNACGTAVVAPADESPPAVHAARLEAYRKAYLGDPNAAMGGILAVNFAVDAAFAAAVLETYARYGKPLKDAGHPNPPGAFFIEVWLAPSFTDEAVQLIRGEFDPTPEIPAPPRKEWGQRVRLLAVGDLRVAPDADEMDLKRIAGGVLMQTRDLVGLNEDAWQVVTQRAPTGQELDDLRLAWLVCKHTKSNAITICKDGMLIGNGAGQMSRVMSCRIATWLARDNGHDLTGAVAASDAFFPFRDGPDLLLEAGVTALIQPGGSKRDEDTIAACNERGVAMIFTGTRHFRH